MSEYWKSTPTYWCKFCETYVRDTAISKQQHEATGKHQGAIQRSLRKLHKDHEIEEREKQRAKDEVERLKGIVSGKQTTSNTYGGAPRLASDKSEPPKQATAEDRKKQLKQLADMGVAIPEEFRKDMAMASEWQTVSTRSLDEDGKVKEEKGDFKSYGVRKRKAEEVEDSEDDAANGPSDKKKGWGSRVKTYGNPSSTNLDFDKLMKPTIKVESKDEPCDHPEVKQEVEKDENVRFDHGTNGSKRESLTEQDPATGIETAPVVFKKRKAKSAKTT